jgi:lysozyme family protein
MKSLYSAFIERLIKRYEGGYVNDPHDPGGPTNFGVTLKVLQAYRKRPVSADDVRNMSIATAKEIYAENYAKPLGFDALPAGVDCTVLDYGVNSGIGRSARVLRRVLSLPDGTTVNTSVIDAAHKVPAADLINAICDERLRFMKSLKGGAMWARYGGGWGTRVGDLRAYSINVAKGFKPQPAPDLSNVPTPKAEVPKPTRTAEGSSSFIGGLIASVAGYLSDIPASHIIGAVVAIVVIGIGVAVFRDYRAKLAEMKVHV